MSMAVFAIRKATAARVLHAGGNALSHAWALANVAAAITRQPFLPNDEQLWVQQQRAQLQHVWRRALLVLSAVSVRNGEHELGIQHAADVLSAEPFDEWRVRH